MSQETVIWILGLIALGAPVLLLCILGATSLLDHKPSEAATGRLCQTAIISGLLATLAIVALMIANGTTHEAVEVGEWVVIPNYHFSVKLSFDRLSLPFTILSFILCGTVSAFATRYLHRERGYNRFFVLYALFVVGIVLTSLAGTIETLFAGWEMVGLSSTLLVAFFQERPVPARNGLRVWIVYRISDAALVLAAIVLHHLNGRGDFDKLLGGGLWPEGHATVAGGSALLVGVLLVVAAAGKSALVPFSGWLPRAMEGPTPSSAIFYGALSVHLGAFLLLRVSPILEMSPLLCGIVVTLGLVTAGYAHFVARAQTDIKSALCFASLTQVGLIVAEIGLGLRYLALIHLIGNACLRTLQFLRAPTLLQDYHLLENAMGTRLPGGSVGHLAPTPWRAWLYQFALERGHLDSLLTVYVGNPFTRVFQWCDRMERRWTNFLTGAPAKPAISRITIKTMDEIT